MNELHLFAGAGGGILGGILLGHTTVCAVELDAYRRGRLLQRQRDGILPMFPIWDDVRTFDGKPWRGIADLVCAGFPCKRFSTIGNLHGSKYFDGWPDTFRIIRDVEPIGVLLENVPAILKRYWGIVLRDLASLGYDVRWGVFSCQDIAVNAPQIGERVFALATPSGHRLEEAQSRLAQRSQAWQPALPATTNGAAWSSRIPEPTILSLADGLANYMGELSAIGDGQIPAMVRLAWNTLNQPRAIHRQLAERM